MKNTILILVLSGLLCGSAIAKERVYTWTDKDGTVHFSDTPTGPQATPMVVSPAKPDRPAPAQPEQKHSDAAGDKAVDDSKPAGIANPNEDPALRKKNCEQSHRVVKSIEDSQGRRLFTENEKGERHWFTDEERVAKLDEAHKAVKKWCN
ncbi:MAG: hypothetical protein FD165_1563 [Gammaproteobacteria bacterium]|nr:MAG: hypothetical protein FD165_1563 [Gammaproteobacteria bacterium]TND05475.1 MAG: hypothetical protein FD120_1083 [Gammaproteobacteria bacterium]